jgi:hypothetical protein
MVHRLVAWAFLGEQGELVVNHKDHNRQNNTPGNLEYITARENNDSLHSRRRGKKGP